MSSILFFTGCGGESRSDSPTTTSLQLKVELPSSSTASQKKKIFQKTSDVVTMQLDVKNSSSAYLYQNSIMEKVNGVWSTSLLLNPADGPFTFEVRGIDASEKLLYAGSATVEDLVSTPSLTIKMDEVLSDEAIVFPRLDGISFLEQSDGMHLLFNVENKSFLDFNYTIEPVNLADGCNPIMFDPMTDLLLKWQTPSRTLDVKFLGKEANETCLPSQYKFSIVTLEGLSSVSYFNLDFSLRRVNINFPPELKSLSIEQLDGGILKFEADALDPEGVAELSYEWSIISGDFTFQGGNQSEPIVALEGYDGTSSVTLMLRIKDGLLVDSASTTRYYTYRGGSTVVTKYKYPIKKTGQTTSYVTFDDGYYKKGVTPSYTRDTTKQVVIDNIEGYMWQDDSNVTTAVDINASEAKKYCQNLTLGGYTDWELPPIHMLLSLLNYNTRSIDSKFQNFALSPTISSTTIKDLSNNSDLTQVSINDGQINYIIPSEKGSVRCLRSHVPLVLLGILNRNSSTGTVFDGRYRLEWQDDYNSSITLMNKSNLTAAISYCEGLTLNKKSDWRLPNIKELITTIDTFNKKTLNPPNDMSATETPTVKQ
jgi:hypothetical protein